ncbi:MAG: (d)CMP kinase [Brevinematia bacterium]
MIITIDGPAGSGKSTIAKMLSERLSIHFLNTGAMYRAVTFFLLQNKIDLNNEALVSESLKNIKINFQSERIFLNNRDVSVETRMPEVEKFVSLVSAIKVVREKMVHLQREIANDTDCVVEGRDTGSVVFPFATYKFYLDASVEERANRRFKELKEKGLNVDFNEIKNEIERRDKLDKSREISPLKVPDGAYIIDTTGLSIEEVMGKILNVINKKSVG